MSLYDWRKLILIPALLFLVYLGHTLYQLAQLIFGVQ